MIITKPDADYEYKLHYLGPKVGGFEDMDDAKFDAPKFASSVFQILGGFVKDP